jgi:hypothetical protein
VKFLLAPRPSTSKPAGATCPPEERIILEKDQRPVCRITAPADELTLNGRLVFEEIGCPAQ